MTTVIARLQTVFEIVDEEDGLMVRHILIRCKWLLKLLHRVTCLFVTRVYCFTTLLEVLDETVALPPMPPVCMANPS
jgi:hypothetical protein